MNVATQVVIPIGAVLMLFALGLTLDLAQLTALLLRPRALVVGLAVRWLVVPGCALLLCQWFRPPPPTVFGVLLLACCPLATPVPALARAAAGDAALGLALTAVTNLASAVTLPVLLSVTTTLAGVTGRVDRAQMLALALRVGALVILPSVLGMALRRARPAFARRVEPRVTPFALLVLLPVVVLVSLTARENLVPALVESGALALALMLLAMLAAAVLARWAGLSVEQAVPVLLGAVLFNFGVCAFVSLTLFREPRFLLPGMAYGLLMWLGVAGISIVGRRARRSSAALAPGGEASSS